MRGHGWKTVVEARLCALRWLCFNFPSSLDAPPGFGFLTVTWLQEETDSDENDDFVVKSNWADMHDISRIIEMTVTCKTGNWAFALVKLIRSVYTAASCWWSCVLGSLFRHIILPTTQNVRHRKVFAVLQEAQLCGGTLSQRLMCLYVVHIPAGLLPFSTGIPKHKRR